MEKAKACKDLLANLFQPPFIQSIKEKQKWKWRRYSSRTTSATFCAFSWRSKPLCWIWSVREGEAGPWRRNPCTACKSGCEFDKLRIKRENILPWHTSAMPIRHTLAYLGIHRVIRECNVQLPIASQLHQFRNVVQSAAVMLVTSDLWPKYKLWYQVNITGMR